MFFEVKKIISLLSVLCVLFYSFSQGCWANEPSSSPITINFSTPKPSANRPSAQSPSSLEQASSSVSSTATPVLVIDQISAEVEDVEGIDVFEIVGATNDQDLLAQPDPSFELEGPPPPLDVPYERDIWQRVRNGFAMPFLDDPRVQTQTNFYGQYPKFVAKVAERAGKYLFYILEELEKRNMPTELALLPFVESSFNPDAISTAKAAGMWQFIPSTGKFYGLDQNLFYDERRDVRASTQAALNYLQRLHNQFQDWFLALASYNWGENAVARAQAKNRREGKPTDYLSLNMPNETRNYVPRLLAIKALIENPNAYRIPLPMVANEPHFIAVYVNSDIDVDRAAELANISIAEFRSLNPSFRKPLIIASANNPILIPEEKADLFVQDLEKEQGDLSSWSTYTLSTKETLVQVAERFAISPDLLASINNISAKAKIHTGSTLLVPRGKKPHTNISKTVIQNARVVLESAPRLVKNIKRTSSKKSKNTRITTKQSKDKTTLKNQSKQKQLSPNKSSTKKSTPSEKKTTKTMERLLKKTISPQKTNSKTTAKTNKNSQHTTKKDQKKQ